ncbi:hypothetical protein Lsai_1862 [Legionella sainthelensi]|uniref:Uncharacterized protein n=1 Tax=Legionella sainthelensi TaxID=28087 RepID=A0A0W0YJ17_9GAMM|nr:hypothetical protein [Legionella sainthelensi]KTD56885.1 hypothetical protein Lsai_1862 [Legionella sainthelensi]VEH37136.1 Uncharacterised protein [Legionella sainthelensi]
MSNTKQMNRLLAILRDEKNSIQERNFALKKLDKEINKQALEGEADFEASFSAFEQQWSQFEEAISVFERDADDADEEVEQLIQQEREKIRLEKRDNPNFSPKKIDTEIKNLESRLQDLHQFTVQDLERRLHVLHRFRVESHERKPNASIKKLEAKLSLFQDRDEKEPQFDQSGPLSSGASDKEDTAHLSQNSINLRTAPITTKVIPKTNIFAAFINHCRLLIQSVGYFMKKLGNNGISLPEATAKLDETQAKLSTSMGKLIEAVNYFKNISDELAKHNKALLREFAKYGQEGKNIPKMQVLLKKIKSSNDVDKDVKLKALEGRILNYKILGSKIREMTHQLDKVNKDAGAAYENLKNAALMHKVATKSVANALNNLELMVDREELIKNQHRIKDRLFEDRKEYEKAKELMESTEEMLKLSHPSP